MKCVGAISSRQATTPQTCSPADWTAEPIVSSLKLLLPAGSLVLGQDQECYGGCFSPQRALSGEIADLRIWSRALGQVSLHDVCTNLQISLSSNYRLHIQKGQADYKSAKLLRVDLPQASSAACRVRSKATCSPAHPARRTVLW